MTVHSALTAHNTGFAVGVVVAALTAAGGSGPLAALGPAVGGGVGLLARGVSGALVRAVLGLKGGRAAYRAALRRASAAIERLVSAVAARAEGVW